MNKTNLIAITVAFTLAVLFILQNLGTILLFGIPALWLYLGHRMYKAGEGVVPPILGHLTWPLAFFISDKDVVERFLSPLTSAYANVGKNYSFEFQSPVVITKVEPVVTMTPKAKKNSSK